MAAFSFSRERLLMMVKGKFQRSLLAEAEAQSKEGGKIEMSWGETFQASDYRTANSSSTTKRFLNDFLSLIFPPLLLLLLFIIIAISSASLFPSEISVRNINFHFHPTFLISTATALQCEWRRLLLAGAT
jgi:hypothetical protein